MLFPTQAFGFPRFPVSTPTHGWAGRHEEDHHYFRTSSSSASSTTLLPPVPSLSSELGRPRPVPRFGARTRWESDQRDAPAETGPMKLIWCVGHTCVTHSHILKIIGACVETRQRASWVSSQKSEGKSEGETPLGCTRSTAFNCFSLLTTFVGLAASASDHLAPHWTKTVPHRRRRLKNDTRASLLGARTLLLPKNISTSSKKLRVIPSNVSCIRTLTSRSWFTASTTPKEVVGSTPPQPDQPGHCLRLLVLRSFSICHHRLSSSSEMRFFIKSKFQRNQKLKGSANARTDPPCGGPVGAVVVTAM